MRSVRTKMRFGGWLALFALGLQLTLSFGHIHAEDFAPANTAVAQNQTVPQNAPSHQNDGDHHDGNDFCAICAVMHMAGTSLLPGAPSVSLPAAITFVVFAAADLTALPPSARQSFQARAPPQA
jgi:hypothetical protein